MTTICGGGSSSPLPGVAGSIYVDQAYVQSLLPAALAWLYPYLPFMHGLQIGSVASFCAVDPPIVPAVPSAADILGFLSGNNLTAFINVNQFLQELTRTYLWYKICGCNVGSPTAYTPPTNPGNMPVVNPPQVTPPTAAPCRTIQTTSVAYDGLPGTAGTLKALLGTYNPGAQTGTGPPFLAGVTYYTYSATLTAAGANHPNMIFNMEFLNASGGLVGALTGPTVVSGGTATFSGTIAAPGSPATWSQIALTLVPASGTVSSDLITVNVNFYCGGGPGQVTAPCCPPDPVLMAQLNQILGLVTLVQRQAVPFSYVAGPVHAGLTGAGVLSVSGLIGAKVDCTTVPASLGLSVGAPDEHFDLGWITWGTADGYPQSVRVEHTPQLSLPPRAGAFTDLAYTLHPGVVATITELVREP